MRSSLPRVVSLLPSATEALCLIGGKHLLVGRSHECDYPEDVKHLPVLTWQKTNFTSSFDVDRQVRESLSSGISLYGLDADLLQSLKPDVILTQNLCDVCSVDLAAVNRVAQKISSNPVVLSLDPYSLKEVMDDLLRIGQVVNLEEQAKIARSKLQQRVDRISSLPKLDVNVAVLEWVDPLYIGGHWTPELIQMAGGKHPLGPAGKKSTIVTVDNLVQSDPDRIIVAPCGLELSRSVEELKKNLESQEWWKQLRAVREGKVAIVDGNMMFNRPGPRLVDALEWLGAWFRLDYQEEKPIDEDLLALMRAFPWQSYRYSTDAAAATKKYSTSVTTLDTPKLDEKSEQQRRHDECCKAGKNTYVDPVSGYQVMTEQYLKNRGWCCGNGCRHCPYGHWNVERQHGRKQAPKVPILLSMDKNRQKLLNSVDSAPTSPCRAVFWSGDPNSLLALDWTVNNNSNKEDIVLIAPCEENAADDHTSPLLSSLFMDHARKLNCDILVVPLPHRCSAATYLSSVRSAIDSHPSLGKRSSIEIVFSDLHLQDVRSWKENAFGPEWSQRIRMKFPLFGINYGDLEATLFGSLCSKYKVQFFISQVHSKLLEKEKFLGQRFDGELMRKFPKEVDPFGEVGEFRAMMEPKSTEDW